MRRIAQCSRFTIAASENSQPDGKESLVVLARSALGNMCASKRRSCCVQLAIEHAQYSRTVVFRLMVPKLHLPMHHE
jgi:hypothetical protein